MEFYFTIGIIFAIFGLVTTLLGVHYKQSVGTYIGISILIFAFACLSTGTILAAYNAGVQSVETKIAAEQLLLQKEQLIEQLGITPEQLEILMK